MDDDLKYRKFVFVGFNISWQTNTLEIMRTPKDHGNITGDLVGIESEYHGHLVGRGPFQVQKVGVHTLEPNSISDSTSQYEASEKKYGTFIMGLSLMRVVIAIINHRFLMFYTTHLW